MDTTRDRRPRPALIQRVLLLAILASTVAAVLVAQPGKRVEGHTVDIPPSSPARSAIGLAPGLSAAGLEPAITLPPAAEAVAAEVEAMRLRNRSRRGPAMRGFVRASVDGPEHVLEEGTLPREEASWRIQRSGEGLVWAARVRVEEAWAVRVGLEVEELAPGAQVWVASESGRRPVLLGPFGSGNVGPDGTMWLPELPGPDVTVEVHVPDASLRSGVAVRFRLGGIVEVFHPDSAVGSDLADACAPQGDASRGTDWESCAIDATCISDTEHPAMINLREAVADILFMEEGTLYGCTATLLADEGQTGTPYLLTANHCFESQASASSLTATFDFRTDTCDGTGPDTSTLPKVYGSTLLATTANSDSTLVQLSGLPAGTVHFMGWTSERPPSDSVLISATHPSGRPQTFGAVEYLDEDEPGVCGTTIYERDRWHLATRVEGVTYYGSSGGAFVLDEAGGLVVGPIRGACFTNPDGPDWCNGGTYDQIIGSLEHFHPMVEQWLGSEGGALFADGFESGDVAAWQ